MKLDAKQVARLEEFLTKVREDIYPEPPSHEHNVITLKMLEELESLCPLKAGMRVLDVGCGQGVAHKQFVAKGCDTVGITLDRADVEDGTKHGFKVLEMDQSFLDFPDDHFDLIWCRHCLEHSVFPYFTLVGFYRALKPGGWLYLEVPAPDTSCGHQRNKNHYSVLGRSMVTELLLRADFKPVRTLNLDFSVSAGADLYWAFFMQKP
jgi:SAM-dependent methyltransferase